MYKGGYDNGIARKWEWVKQDTATEEDAAILEIRRGNLFSELQNLS
jgi:hypothetical protein